MAELYHPADQLKMWNFESLDAAWQKMGTGRASGLHLTDIIYGKMYCDHFGKKPGFADPSQEDRESPGIRMQMGYMWERVFDWAWKEVGQHQEGLVTQLHGVEKDGIHMTPDGALYKLGQNHGTPEYTALAEFKATWRSMRAWENDPEEEFITWFWQTKAYAYALGLNKIQFFVFFVNGDYRYAKGRGPIAISQEFQYSDEELKSNWDKILAYKEIHVRESD